MQTTKGTQGEKGICKAAAQLFKATGTRMDRKFAELMEFKHGPYTVNML